MSEKVIKAGVVGVGRGSILWRYCQKAKNAKLVAVCDKWEDIFQRIQTLSYKMNKFWGSNIKYVGYVCVCSVVSNSSRPHEL